MAGGVGLTAPSGPTEVGAVLSGGREGVPLGEVTVEGRSRLVRSTEQFVDRLVDTARECGDSALDEMMEVAASAQTLFQDPGRQSSAIARIILMFGKKLGAAGSQLERLADVVKDISFAQAPAAASASADGGDSAGTVDLTGDATEGARSAAPADGGGMALRLSPWKWSWMTQTTPPPLAVLVVEERLRQKLS
eukprot:2400275-Alexandrium_andersonii.AAC.1